jgi:HSP20 family molecular chaperone IbpA
MLVRHRTFTPTLDRTFDRSFDRAFEQLTNSFFDTRRSNGPVVDGAWIDDEYVLTVDLPGVPAEAVTVEVTGTTLSLGATTESLDWKRSVRIGERLDPDKVRARHLDGRLTVRIGTVDEPEARSIAIDTAATDRAIDATSSEAAADDGQTTDAQSTETNDTE